MIYDNNYDIEITSEHSFEDLTKLSKELSEEEFENLRKQIIQSEINRLSSGDPETKLKLEQVQFRVESACRNATTPLSRCIIVSQMMHDSLLKLQDALQNFRMPQESEQLSQCSILPINKRRVNDEQHLSTNKEKEKE